MTVINKQRFLKELGGLLTFMSEDDRQEALMLYEKMFDDAEDEQELISALISPTRQAVIIARAYDSSLRRRPISAQEEDPENTPDFILAILRVYDECVPLPAYPEEGDYAPAEGTLPAAELPEEGDNAAEPAPCAAPEEAAEPPEAQSEEEEAPEIATQRAFLAAVNAAPAEPDEKDEEDYPHPRSRRPEETTRRVKPWMLALFLLCAVPLTALGVGLLLIPTLLSLLLSAGAIVGGCAGILAAFSGFAMFADLLIVLGSAIVMLALGLLFAWLFVWFIGGAIAGLIRGMVALGKSWCYGEVAV